MRSRITVSFMLMVALCGSAAAKSAGNRPYVVAFAEHSPFYARCLPAKNTGDEGTTQILRVSPEGDEVVTTFAWYNRNGIVMGWSPKAGKVAVMRVHQDEGLPTSKQIELSFYLGDHLLRSYTTDDLVKLGAKVERDASAIERGLGASSKRATYHVEGCKQAWNTNDYYFSVRLNDTQTLSFDILTGNLCRVEQDGSKQRLVPVDDDTPVGESGGGPVALLSLASQLEQEFGGTWISKDYGFGQCLTLSELPKEMKSGNFLVCGAGVENINAKLVECNISAPFKVVATTRHLQVLSWLQPDNVHVRRLISVIKRKDP